MDSSPKPSWRSIATREAIDRTASSYSDLKCWIVLSGSGKRIVLHGLTLSRRHAAIDDKVNARASSVSFGRQCPAGTVPHTHVLVPNPTTPWLCSTSAISMVGSRILKKGMKLPKVLADTLVVNLESSMRCGVQSPGTLT
jgi:hypothetical protein